MSDKPGTKPIASPKRDLKRISENSQAVVGELREFLATLKGKSPKEMMGSVAESNLAKSLVVSCLVMITLLFALSAIPYAMKDGEDQANETPEEESEKSKEESSATDEKTEDTKTPAEALEINEAKPDEPPEIDVLEPDLLDQ
ncbi:MAG: hypothetical protein CMI30_03320 [Opitutae bacterium]|nr:hypothetical protein [Opitutae bacterium]|tara:strand:- start:606 stop:1034 length:429 start_codon:yes stop_codon:yes gene_type:complete